MWRSSRRSPALLYGYSLWGGIKELTAAFLLVLGAALFAQVIVARPQSPRRLLPLAVAAAALIVTLGAGAAAWVVPALVGVVIVWVFRARQDELWVAAVELPTSPGHPFYQRLNAVLNRGGSMGSSRRSASASIPP